MQRIGNSRMYKRSLLQYVREYRFALWELTKRELKRKYARSYMGILWSIFYPLLRMILVVIMFSVVFSKGIEKYPAYYFAGFLLFECFSTATTTSLTCLKDNRDFLFKTKLPREILVLSRILTAFVNTLLGFIPFILVLIIYRAKITVYILLMPVIFLLFLLFIAGASYALAIIYVVFPDIKDIHSNVIFILRFFVAIFYSIDWIAKGVQNFIIHNPLYAFIKLTRDCMVYGTKPEVFFIIEIVVWSLGLYLFGKMLFKLCVNRIIERL